MVEAGGDPGEATGWAWIAVRGTPQERQNFASERLRFLQRGQVSCIFAPYASGAPHLWQWLAVELLGNWQLGQIFSAVPDTGAVTAAGQGFPQVKQKRAVGLFGVPQCGHFLATAGVGGIVSSAGEDTVAAAGAGCASASVPPGAELPASPGMTGAAAGCVSVAPHSLQKRESGALSC
jgi:hypothetical protein